MGQRVLVPKEGRKRKGKQKRDEINRKPITI